MSGTYAVAMGGRGRLAIPAAVRVRFGLVEGAPMILRETPGGLVLMTRAQARDMVRRQLAGMGLVAQLVAGRRAAAAAEDVQSL